jgi:hypothetical protein
MNNNDIIKIYAFYNLYIMKKFLNIATYVFCVLVLSMSNCTAQSDTKGTVHKEFKGITLIDISTVSGSCEITKGDNQFVTIDLSYDYKPAKSFEPIFSQGNNTLTLKEQMHGSNSGHSKWILTVPEHMDITFSSASGGIHMKGIQGKIKVKTASGNVKAEGISILADSKFSSSSGSVHIAFNETPKFDILASSASGDALLDFNQNPVIGKIEMKSRTEYGKIICPFKFDAEKEELVGNQKYVVKSFTVNQDAPTIKIHTASGKAILKK